MQRFRPQLKSAAFDSPRFRGHRGGIITMHRALAQLRFGPSEMITSVTLAAVLTSTWILLLARVSALWKGLFVLALRFLPLQAEVRYGVHQLGLGVALSVPYFAFDPVVPSARVWAASCVAVLGIFAITFLFPSNLIPVTYLLRSVLFVQASSLIYFAAYPAQFPYAPSDYLEGVLMSGVGLIATVPTLFLLTYYIFPFSLFHKVFLTALTMVYLAIFLPLQVVTHAVILQKSIMFMPVLYLVFGMPLDVLIIIALYAWGMTWRFKS